MAPIEVGILGIILMLFFLILGMPVGFTLAIAGFIGMVAIIGFSASIPQLHISLYKLVSNYSYTVLPFFILMGNFAGASGISSDLYKAAGKWLRRLPGGLSLATIAACAGFASISGSSVATAATIGSVALPEMKKNNYSSSLSAGTIAAGGTLGFLIPPSVAFVVYGIVAEQSIGKLLLAGILPGIILAVAFMLVITLQVKINPNLAPANLESSTWKEKLLTIKDVWGVLLVFLLVMGGIYLGFFTPTEAGAVGACILFIFALLRRKINTKTLLNSLKGTAETSVMIFIIIYGATLFGQLLTLSLIPTQLAAFIGSLQVSKYVVLALIIVVYLIIGCFIESVPMIILVVPVVLPIITSLGFDPLWFGVISVLMVEAALITPPVGLNVYVIAGIAKDIPLTTVFRGVFPFLFTLLLVTIILVAVPSISLFLPGIIK